MNNNLEQSMYSGGKCKGILYTLRLGWESDHTDETTEASVELMSGTQ